MTNPELDKYPEGAENWHPKTDDTPQDETVVKEEEEESLRESEEAEMEFQEEEADKDY